VFADELKDAPESIAAKAQEAAVKLKSLFSQGTDIDS